MIKIFYCFTFIINVIIFHVSICGNKYPFSPHTRNKIRPSSHSKLSSRFRDIDGLYEIVST